MEPLDFLDLFEGEPAELALLSTFTFDPVFFEELVLNKKTLYKARRIAVFVDKAKWDESIQNNDMSHVRKLNSRYLVVPVSTSPGVFHPKLDLIITSESVQVVCGSNNLTRSGCLSNREIINSIKLNYKNSSESDLEIACEAFHFFQSIAESQDNKENVIAMDWLEEVARYHVWISNRLEDRDRTVRLLHSYKNNIWEELVEYLDGESIKKIIVMSPFHDLRAEMCQQVANQWPGIEIDIVGQQGYTTLSTEDIKNIENLSLFEFSDQKRRVHAKLLIWETDENRGCLVGSSNFTTPGLHGKNIEANFLIREAGDHIDELFDDDFFIKPIEIDEFQPGEPDLPDADTETLRLFIESAHLSDSNRLHVQYKNEVDYKITDLHLEFRVPGEEHPRKEFSLDSDKESAILSLSDDLLDEYFRVYLVNLFAKHKGVEFKSPFAWVIQEEKLTYEPSNGSSNTENMIKETGEGLISYLDSLGEKGGYIEVVEYLNNLNIKFMLEEVGGGGRGGRNLTPRDPIRSDEIPQWVFELEGEEEISKAVCDFVDRHIERRLEKHAKQGNLNGIDNFLDIFTTCTELLHEWYSRDKVSAEKIVSKYNRLIEVATSGEPSISHSGFGNDTNSNDSGGYIESVYGNLSSSNSLLRDESERTNFCGEIRAAFLISQHARASYEKGEKFAGQMLPSWEQLICKTIRDCGLTKPSQEQISEALNRYRHFSIETRI